MAEGIQPLALFSGIATEVNRALGVTSYRHRKPFQSRPPTQNQGQILAISVFEVMHDRFSQLASNNIPLRKPSLQNWRIRSPQLRPWNPRNPEVDLERRLVRARQAPDWWNQVPIASGLGHSAGDRRRCIDLVHERGPGSYDFVELKVGSDTPVYAAVEILQYGFVWLLSRHYRDILGYSRECPTLLDGNEVGLHVLAPSIFYRNFHRTAFEVGLNNGVKIIASRFDATMSFNFLEFDLSNSTGDDRSLRGFLDQLFAS